MKQQLVQQLPFFLGFKLRNKIINENCTKQKDIIELKNQYQILTSYMKDKEIHQGINKRLSELYTSKKRVNFAVSNSVDAFKKNQVTTRYGLLREIGRAFKYGHRSIYLNSGFNLHDLAFLGRIGAGSGAISDTGLKAYWKFSEVSGDIINQSQSAVDLGQPADLQVTGMTYNQAQGPFNYSGLGDGVDDKAVAGTSLSQFNYHHNTTALWTILFWARSLSTGADTVVFDDQNGPSGAVGFIISFASQQIRVSIANGTTAVINEVTTASYVPDTTNWYAYAISYEQALGSNNLKIRRNNANLEQFTKSAETPSDSNAAFAHRLFSRNTASSAGFWNGYLSEVSDWNKIVSDADQTTWYDGGIGREIY